MQATPSLGLSGEFQLGAFGLPDLLGPGLSTWLSGVPALQPVLNNVVIKVMLKPSLSGEAEFQAYPQVAFQSVTLTGDLALEALYEPKIWGMEIQFTVGGDPSVTFQYPGDPFQQLNFKAYAKGEVKAWAIDWEDEFVFVDYTYASSPSRRLPTTGVYDLGNGYLIESSSNAVTSWKPVDRSYLNQGTEQFLLAGGPARRLSTTQSAALDLFCRMGSAPSPGAVYQPPASGPSRRIISDPTLPAQANLPVISNVYPDAEPTLAASGSNLMLLYARDTGVQNPVQFTEIAFTALSGTTWSTPASVAATPCGQFAPKVMYDGSGNAVAVWEQIKDPTFSGTDITSFAAEMEIMTSTWNAKTQTWSPATALTNNTFLDHSPQLAGPLSNGDLILTWVQNQDNQMIGSGTTGALNNDQVMTMHWNCATSTWGSASVLVGNLSSDLSHSLAAAGNKAVYIWSQDQDGNLNNLSDTELYYRVWNQTTGTWGATTRYTSNSVSDIYAKAAVSASGRVATGVRPRDGP